VTGIHARSPEDQGVVGRRLIIPLLLIAGCLGLVACGSNKESQAEAKQHLCSSLDNFKTTVSSLQGLSLSSTEDDLNAATDKVNKAWDQVVQDAKDVKNVSVDKIKSAYDDLENAVKNRPTDQPITQVVAGLQPKVTAFTQAWTDFAKSVDCKASS
jgi:lipopolysaccharide export LptBFGC system permease protein LptF